MLAPKPTAPPTTSQLDTSQGNATAALYSAAIGPISNDYYLPLFTQFEEMRRPRLAWNWAACLYTVNWMVFRGLGLAALAYAAIVAGAALLLLGLGHLIFQLSPVTELTLLATLLVLVFGGPGLLGNWLLYTVYRKKMANALRESATLLEACAVLTRQASSRQRFLWLVSANALAVAATIALYGWSALRADGSVIPSITSAAQPSFTADIPVLPKETASLPRSEAPSSSAQSGLVTNVELPAPTANEVQAPGSSVPLSAPDPAADVNADLGTALTPTLTSRLPATKTPLASPSITTRQALPARQRFYINVGLFAQEVNAQNTLNKLEKAGLPTLSGTVSTLGGQRTRVRAGPFKSEQEASAAAASIRALKLDAVVIQPSSQ